jgi:hypothetical protein
MGKRSSFERIPRDFYATPAGGSVADSVSARRRCQKIQRAVLWQPRSDRAFGRSRFSHGERVVLDFSGITLATQSFIHALISGPLRSEREAFLDKVEFRGCDAAVKGIIETVVQYSLETTEDSDGASA